MDDFKSLMKFKDIDFANYEKVRFLDIKEIHDDNVAFKNRFEWIIKNYRNTNFHDTEKGTYYEVPEDKAFNNSEKQSLCQCEVFRKLIKINSTDRTMQLKKQNSSNPVLLKDYAQLRLDDTFTFFIQATQIISDIEIKKDPSKISKADKNDVFFNISFKIALNEEHFKDDPERADLLRRRIKEINKNEEFFSFHIFGQNNKDASVLEIRESLLRNYKIGKLINIAINSSKAVWDSGTAKMMMNLLIKDENIKKIGPTEQKLFEEICSGSKQIILTGAPGTGKTHSARTFAEIITGNTDWKDGNARKNFVQFHPSFDYTDFVEGLRPVWNDENASFVRMDGVFMEFCRKAKANEPCFFIIDEINRADLSKVFGELMFSLEESYRKEGITTQYAHLPTYYIADDNTIDYYRDEKEKDVFKNGFLIPENVYIIGTMNNIDRSVDTFDYALRRRFKWISIDVDNELFSYIFESMKDKAIKKAADADSKEKIEKQSIYGEDGLIKKAEDINAVIEEFNSILNPAKDYYIGPAYYKDYFFSGDSFENIFADKIQPLLKEYVRGRDTSPEENRLANRCREILKLTEKTNPQLFDKNLGIWGNLLLEKGEEDFGYIQRVIIDEICRGSKQIILTGAPGTGKTFSARKLVEKLYLSVVETDSNYIKESDPQKKEKIKEKILWKENNCFVQFHPSYDYADFVEGLKPAKVKDKSTFVRMDGHFKSFCRKFAGKQDAYPHFFIIDEINRADLSKVFGELMFSLEETHRNEAIPTQYNNIPTFKAESGDPNNTAFKEVPDIYVDGFTIPDNIIIIGTMNEIDRSVDTFDFALRRRFKWVSIDVDTFVRVDDVDVDNSFLGSTIKEMVDDSNITAEDKKGKMKYIMKVINNLNGVINDPEYSYIFRPAKDYFVGPAYFKSFFAGETIENIYSRKVEPLLYEYVRGRDDKTIKSLLRRCEKAVKDTKE